MFVCLFKAAPAAYGGSQAQGRIRAVATGQCRSNARSEPHLGPTPQLRQFRKNWAIVFCPSCSFAPSRILITSILDCLIIAQQFIVPLDIISQFVIPRVFFFFFLVPFLTVFIGFFCHTCNIWNEVPRPRYQIQATPATCATLVAMPDPEPTVLGWGSNPGRCRDNTGFFFFFFFFLLLFRATPTAYVGSQARGQIGAVATSPLHSHSNSKASFKLHL